jgi:sugar phosphate isomerase/epimerase
MATMQLGFLTDGRIDDVAFAAAEGFDCLEVALFGDTPLFDDASALKRALAAHAIPIAAVSLFGQDYFDPITGTERLTRLERTIDLTAALGAPIVVFGTGSGAPTPAAGVAHLAAAIARAHGLGLTVAFYNCHWENTLDRPDAWDAVLPDAPELRIKFDPSHPIQGGRDWKAELLAAGSRVVHTHAKDVLQVGTTFVSDPNPGLGDIRWETFFGLLTHIGFDGAVCIEPHSPAYTGPRRYDFLRLSGRYLRQFFV